jgi:ABC-type glycerol-3-phosphate transport system substrate-binding protein
MLTWKGSVYGIPFAASHFALYYNKARFREAGLDDRMPPTTLSQLDAFAEKLSIYDADGTLTHAGFDAGHGDVLAWIVAFGGRLYDADEFKVTATHPNNIKWLEWVKQNADKYGYEAVERLKTGEFGFDSASRSPLNPFNSGKIAMWMEGNWEYWAGWTNYPRTELNVASTPIPQVPGQKPYASASYCDPLMIPKGSKNPDEAVKWMKHLITSPIMITEKGFWWIQYAGVVSKKLWYLPENRGPYRDWWTFTTIIEGGNVRPHPQMPVYDKYRSEVQEARTAVRAGLKTPEQALADVQELIQTDLDELLGG